MSSREIRWTFFGLMVLAQLYVPAGMIWGREDVLRSGKEYKFRTAPVDPNDPFRGKYIMLSYEDVRAEVENEAEWNWGEAVYLTLSRDSEGFAQIDQVGKDMPEGEDDVIKGRVSYVSSDGSHEIRVDYPFDRFYMEESKALPAEGLYWESLSDSSRTTWAVVSVKDGEAVLKDVVIDGVSIVDLVEESNK